MGGPDRWEAPACIIRRLWLSGALNPRILKMMQSRVPFLLACLVLVLPVLLTGCAGTAGVGGGSGSFVSTSVQNSSSGAVRAAVKAVFREEGFSLINEGSNNFHFRKWGGKSTEIIYGSWFTDGVAIEPEVVVFDKGAGNFTVHCDVYMREHNGSELLDANWRLLGSGKMAYNGMMKKIKKHAEGS